MTIYCAVLQYVFAIWSPLLMPGVNVYTQSWGSIGLVLWIALSVILVCTDAYLTSIMNTNQMLGVTMIWLSPLTFTLGILIYWLKTKIYKTMSAVSDESSCIISLISHCLSFFFRHPRTVLKNKRKLMLKPPS